MKKILFLLSVLLGAKVNAQVTINLFVNPMPVATLSQWGNQKNILSLSATIATGGSINAKINTVIKTVSGEAVATTDMQRAVVKTIRGGTNNLFSAYDVMDFNAMVFSGSYQKQLNKTGKLPAGMYQITVQLQEAAAPVAISNAQTKMFTIANVVLPILMKPYDGEQLKEATAKTAIQFRWTPVVPRPSNLIKYKLTVFDVLPFQTAIQAIRGNAPLLEKIIVGATQFVWSPQLSFLDSINKNFVWTIQSLDDANNPIVGEVAGGQGVSEPKTFSIATNNYVPKIKCNPYRNVTGPFNLCKELNTFNLCLTSLCQGGNLFTNISNDMLQNPAVNFGFTFTTNQVITVQEQQNVMRTALAWAIANAPSSYEVSNITYSPNVVVSGGQSTSFIKIVVAYRKCTGYAPAQ
jgi:hypothetical protein